MSVTKILENIDLYIKNNSNNPMQLKAIRKEFAQALNNYVDFRIEAVLNERQNLINNSTVALLDRPADIALILDALSLVPKPPELNTDFDLWLLSYIDWYDSYYSPIVRLTEYNGDTLNENSLNFNAMDSKFP